MTNTEQRAAAAQFVTFWAGKGYEKGESQPFWLSLLRDVLGIPNPEAFIRFEAEAMLDHTSFIDGFIAATHVLIEQKGLGKDLKKPIRQSDSSLLTPFQQALRYAATLPYSQRPRWIVTCNFASFLVYDMENPNSEPEEILLRDLPKEVYRLRFLVDTGDDKIKKEMKVSIEAGELVGILYDAILKQYRDPESTTTQRSLNMLCVRLVFCLYAEDAGIFGSRSAFHDFLARYPAPDIRNALVRLFKVLDTKPADRDPYLDPGLAAFPYVNGGLFADETIVIPQFTDEIRSLLLNRASAGFDWSAISPTIFGAVFESTLNPETRRAGGMHYTSIENIHKVIDPLFLDGLRADLAAARAIPVAKTRAKALEAFQQRLASLSFLDPACGSGNFLTETYLSLRRLENNALRMLFNGQGQLGLGDIQPIKVSIGQFYGIEINDFAVTVARTALWIAECQMMEETEDIIHAELAFLPLKAYPNIVEGDALRTDWVGIVPPTKLSYIMGNPPFVGFTFQSAEQKKDMAAIFPGTKNLDFVCAWFKKASDFIKGTDIHCGFVATNSVTQGETVASFWKFLAIRINYAYRTFIWNNEAKQKAHVHCVIIGFSTSTIGRESSPCESSRIIFDEGGRPHPAANINAYLIDAPNLIVTSRQEPLCDVPLMVYGNKPADGGNLIIEDADYPAFIAKEPQAAKFIRPLLGAEEYLHSKKRWVLWLRGAAPAELQKCPLVLDRIAKCREMREHSIAAAIRKFALTPTLFAQITQPEGKDYIIVPEVSSESRRYIPMAFLPSRIICTNLVKIIPDATLYHFGVLESNVHMAWMRAVCGRLKSDYRYLKDIVYNNFPWPEATEDQKARIERTAQGILGARQKYPTSSLADLYDPLTMPPELIAAHQANDRAVMAAYGFPVRDFAESDCVAALMKLYQQKTAGSGVSEATNVG